MDLVFDSNIIIDQLKGYPEAAREIRQATGRLLSVISWMEVLVGCPNEETERLARALMATFEVIPVSAAVAEDAVTIRRLTRMKLPDAIVLATARIAGVRLSTRNTRDFSEADPTIRVPYRL